jgi:ubiquitin carboxyl-terminal hydrolase 1
MRDRITNPSILITVALVAATIVYRAAQRQRRLPPLPQLLWDASISLIPARLLFCLDRLINPPLFPTHMLTTQSTTHAAKSEALRRILGIESGGGIIGSVSQAGRKGFGTLSRRALGNSSARDRPPGLGNLDNSCYQNSILQGLASLKPLPAYLSAISLDRRVASSPTRTVDTLRDFMAQLGGASSNGRTLWTPRVLKNMSTWQQQDAQEYYSKLLDQIDNEIAKASRVFQDAPALESEGANCDSSASQHSDDSGYHSSAAVSKPGPELRLARNPLEGLIAQRVACVNCGYCEGLTMIPFNCLTLTLGTLPQHDLYERLDHYTKVESIEGVECAKCSLIKCRDLLKKLTGHMEMPPELQQRLQLLEEALEDDAYDEATLEKCNIKAKARVSSTKTKQVALARPPQSLVLHVNRSGFDERTGYMFKNPAAVRFPVVLDLAPWCLGSAGSRGTLEEGAVPAQDVEQWTLDPRSSMVAADRGPSRVTGPIYELRAVVTHYGHHENGHYVCYRKHPVSSPTIAPESEGAKEGLEHASAAEAAGGDIDSVPETGSASEGGETVGTADTKKAAQPIETEPAQDASKAQWWRLSDEDVTPVDEQTVLAQGGVFMLFYDCVDPKSVPVSGLDEYVGTEQVDHGHEAPNLAPTALVAAPSPADAPENPEASTDVDGDDSQHLNNTIPPLETSASNCAPAIPGVDESAAERQAPSPGSDEPDDTPVPVDPSLELAQEQETIPGESSETGETMDGFLTSESLRRVAVG